MKSCWVSSEEARTRSDVYIESNVNFGQDVRVGVGTIIYDNVEIGDNVFIGPNVIIGEPLSAFYADKVYTSPKTIIGSNSIIRAGTTIYAGSSFGENFQTGNNATIREYSVFGKDCSVGSFSQVEGYITVGDYCRFHTNVLLGEKTIIKNYVLIFPGVVLTNVLHPPCTRCMEGPTIEDCAVLCVNSVIMPKVRIGKNALVGACSFVMDDVPDNSVVVGSPARVLKNIEDVKCLQCIVDKTYPWIYQKARRA